MTSEMTSKKSQIVSSAMWAAYGDALGFITELVPPSVVAQRVGQTHVYRTVAWRKNLGGRAGAAVELPAGAYSDDTQLRLATSRAVRADGSFDVESFAKVELPVWLNYALGAGRGSKMAAGSLGGKKANWFSNFFDTAQSVYVNGGGNGAAMRIQPHVWAAADLKNPDSYLVDVVRNAVCTHGHVRGIAGAMVHAVCLAIGIRDRGIMPPEQWLGLSEVIACLPELVHRDRDLKTFWLPTWEARVGRSLRAEVDTVCAEWVEASRVARKCLRTRGSAGYYEAVEAIGGLTNAERGSGLKTALLALYAAHEFQAEPCASALTTVANLYNSDTDTIATMAGALLGAVSAEKFEGLDLQDDGYIASEAERLYEVSCRTASSSFAYPDLLYWQAPRPLDAISLIDGQPSLLGLGPVEAMGEEYAGSQPGATYQWYRTAFGQAVLSKRRQSPRSRAESVLYQAEHSLPRRARAESATDAREVVRQETGDMFGGTIALPAREGEEKYSLDEATDVAIRSNFDPETVGRMLLAMVSKTDGIECAVAFAAIIAKAKAARARRGK